MGKTLYLECYSGISGDMTVASLLDLGASQEVLMEVIESLPLHGFQIEISRVMKSGIDACDFNVILDVAHENHDHDMAYLHGSAGEAAHVHSHEDEHHHDHDHSCGDGHHHDHEHTHDHGHTHTHEHRGMPEIREIIAQGNMTDGARQLTLRIFQILAEAEAKAHNKPIEEVHFHEVGAVDSIIDIVAVAVCMDNLGITDVIVPRLCEGTGVVRCQHGMLPIPVPAVSNIVNAHKLKLQIIDVQGEFVTPTGAAIVAAVKTSDVLPKDFEVQRIGIGAGKREYERPSMLRAMLIESSQEKDSIYKLESNIDDCSGEALGYVMDELFEAGARDVHYTPVFMKKNRPGWMLSVICKEEDIPKLEQIIFHGTTTIGIRRMEMERSILKRSPMNVMTDYGEAEVKVCEIGEEKRYYPECDSIVNLCKKSGKSYMDIYQHIVAKCQSI